MATHVENVTPTTPVDPRPVVRVSGFGGWYLVKVETHDGQPIDDESGYEQDREFHNPEPAGEYAADLAAKYGARLVTPRGWIW